MNSLLASSFKPLTLSGNASKQHLSNTEPDMFTERQASQGDSELPLGSRCPRPARDTCRRSTCTNVSNCKKLLSLWLQPQPHLQRNWVGCGKEISLCRVWTGNHCSGFESPTLGFVDLSLDHISSLVNLSVCVSSVEEWRCDSIRPFFSFVCVLLPLSTGVPPFNLKAWDWEKSHQSLINNIATTFYKQRGLNGKRRQTWPNWRQKGQDLNNKEAVTEGLRGLVSGVLTRHPKPWTKGGGVEVRTDEWQSDEGGVTGGKLHSSLCPTTPML